MVWYATGAPVASTGRKSPRLVAKGRVPAMVQLAKQDPTTVYVVLEGERTIGRVVAPAGEPVLAAGAGTVLLMRGQVGAAA